jgi:hypothetical protein
VHKTLPLALAIAAHRQLPNIWRPDVDVGIQFESLDIKLDFKLTETEA